MDQSTTYRLGDTNLSLHRSSDAAGAIAKSASAGAPLGTIARYHSPASQCGAAAPPPRDYETFIRRYALQSAARELLPRERVALCLRRPVPNRSVDVLYAPAKQSAHFGGLQVCGSVWMCPPCAAKVSERRRIELQAGLLAWSGVVGQVHRVLLVTFTLSHHIGDSLSTVFATLKRARLLLLGGKYAIAFREKYAIVGMVRALELTYGENGWHPHLHVLYFFGREVPIIPFTDEIKLRWASAVKSAGGFASYQHGCDVRFSDADIADYIAKWGREPKWTVSHEMTKSVSKYASRDGKTPLQLLSEYMYGDAAAGRLWMQYALNFKGERQLYWSRGLRAMLGLEVEKSDEELAKEQDEVAIILASLSIGAWRVVLANDARGELLEVASSGDMELVCEFLASLGVDGV